MAVFENVIVGILIAGIVVALGVSNISRDDRDSVVSRPSESNVAYPADTQEGVRMSGDYNGLPTATPIADAYSRGGKTKRKRPSRKQTKRKK